MKYLKYFEAKIKNPQELLIEYADDIVRVLPLYYNNHSTDSLHNQIDELIWECRESDRLRGDDEVLSEEVVRQLIEDLTGNFYIIEKLLDIYYDCLPHTKHINKDKIEILREIFLDYSDDGEISISKTSKFNDERYEVRLKLKDVFLKMNFEEVIGRVKEFMGIEDYHVSATKDLITMEFFKPLSNGKEYSDLEWQ
jgi:hypothetical protein